MRPVRSMLYVPGNSPGMLQHCATFGADSVLLDLEDAVALSEKDAARDLVCEMLKVLDFGSVVVTVRVNGADTEFFQEDLRAVVPLRPHAVRIPKCSSPEDVILADRLMGRIEEEHGLPVGSVRIHAMLETARGVVNALEIGRSSPRVEALTLGGQDLTADMGVSKTREGWELFVARSQVALAARSLGLQALDTVWADVDDHQGLYEEARRVVGLGFTGKAAIHPSQIEWIHRAFVPELSEVERARRIVDAARRAHAEGKGVVSVDGRMVDAPVVRRAENTLRLWEMGEVEGL
ncbi:Citrate (pro-3S)-lyase [Thermanaerovibrio acidaminovorans DSM 6589]|uniref:Citrate (Pro-3S)-lyase n=1 Tax=Thermanaerovibrio acidaminovorans (strain ATCC 49978 / DSM 6589 / Su883) TaxID=525903 RepID=D1B8H4_THEAS|nr:CoA ester lyase [Thermanaerovibrio acidaminovorans]ACZ18577.1 Citrate (pro-3S)-lyase [Thermanaerovibrio acidaminovorans DSM 6589]